MLGKIEGRRISRRQRVRWLDVSKLWEIVKDSLAFCSPQGGKESDTT